ncbi:IMP-specific 5'-nucleotidase 1 [Polychaeton citri CBS 116435]|uniref:IMP-specific 5'-nucleotidase 1 n=1 Tax=Polychaeton citri CBS 116435 TaxID=1314669 RepID=A0A9P4QHC0_9PEZI|nr:IMP-specific 5'-nucleotidase 1 [Polychaeton citri CBS 116435]
MTTRYRVEYALKTHRRDQFIEWIKGLLAVPFVLLSQPTAVYEKGRPTVYEMAASAHERYAQIMRDVEGLIEDHIAHQNAETHSLSKLKLLVPTVGMFFTSLPMHEAFKWQDERRFISSRRFVAPSFNDVRLILNTAQAMSLVRNGKLDLVTFDGDVTLYDDGESLVPENPVIPRILNMMRSGTRIGIVTAAGYLEAARYYDRLHGLLDAIAADEAAPDLEDKLIVMGGESNFLFTYTASTPSRLKPVPKERWHLPEMGTWTEANIEAVLDIAEAALNTCVESLRLPVRIVRKERAVGIVPQDGIRLSRESLEETVLITQRILELSPAATKVPFCAFNGGNDIFVDIGDKSWGVRACQGYFGGIDGGRSLHVGDQFLSAGANDFKARLACTTAWIASPAETVALLDEITLLVKSAQNSTTIGQAV